MNKYATEVNRPRRRLRQFLFSINTVNTHKGRRDNIEVVIDCHGANAILIIDIAECLRLETSTKISSEKRSKKKLGQVTGYVMKGA